MAGKENKCSPNFQIASLNKEKEVVCICVVKVLVNSIQNTLVCFVMHLQYHILETNSIQDI